MRARAARMPTAFQPQGAGWVTHNSPPRVCIAPDSKPAYYEPMMRPVNSRREVLFHLSDVARVMRTYIDQRAREHGMTRARWGVLARLARKEGMTQAEMAETLEIQPISIVRLIGCLRDHGLVERRPHPRDRRANLFYLTEKGCTT